MVPGSNLLKHVGFPYGLGESEIAIDKLDGYQSALSLAAPQGASLCQS